MKASWNAKDQQFGKPISEESTGWYFSVEQLYVYINNGVSGNNAFAHTLTYAFIYRRYVVVGYGSSKNGIFKFVAS